MKKFFLFIALILAGSVQAASLAPMPINRNGVTTNATLMPQVFPLSVRAYTGLPNLAHPSVLRFSTNWNGFNFWYCDTPYPPGTTGLNTDTWIDGAENPSIYVSQDGIRWASASSTNPVASNGESTLYNNHPGTPRVGDSGGHLSDGEIFLRPDGTMNLYYRANNGFASTTSASSTLIGTGAKSFTVPSGLGWYAGLRCRIYSGANNNNFMEGVVSSYASTTLSVTVDTTGGSGTFSDWTVTCDSVYLVVRTSTDGVGWSAPFIIKTNLGGNALLSPQVTQLQNGTIRLFAGYGDPLSNTIDYWDATDARGTNFNWASRTSTGITTFWHFDARWKTGNELWIIASTAGGLDPYSTLRLYVSGNNGSSFSQVTAQVNPYSGAKWDAWGYYKPDFLFNDDGTIDLYTSSGMPFVGSTRAAEALAAGYSESLQPFYAAEAWRVGLFKNLTVQTNTPTTNMIPAGTSYPLTMTYNSARTNWECMASGEFWMDRLGSRRLLAEERLDANGPLYLFSGHKTSSVKLIGDGGTLWFTHTNTGNWIDAFRIGGDGSSGAPGNRAMYFYMDSTLVRGYIWVGHSFADTTGELQIGANGSSGNLANFVVNATTSLFSGDVGINTAGKGLQVKEGSNAKMGLATLTAGSVVVSTTAVTANSRIFITEQATGGTPGFVRVSARTAGTSFTITSSSGTDTSTVAWMIVEPL